GRLLGLRLSRSRRGDDGRMAEPAPDGGTGGRGAVGVRDGADDWLCAGPLGLAFAGRRRGLRHGPVLRDRPFRLAAATRAICARPGSGLAGAADAKPGGTDAAACAVQRGGMRLAAASPRLAACGLGQMNGSAATSAVWLPSADWTSSRVPGSWWPRCRNA